MFPDRNKPIDYIAFKRRSRWRATLQAVAAITWFNCFLAFLFIACMLLIYFGSYFR